jgi:molecular chaperone DnaK
MLQVPVVQGESERVGDNAYLGDATIEKLPPSPAHSPIEVTFELDLSGVLHVTAKHVPSGVQGMVTFAHSPYRLTEQRRKAAREQVKQLEATVKRGDVQEADEADLSLARAMLTRGRKALEKATDAAPEVLNRLKSAIGELNRAVENKLPTVPEATDKVSDVLLDLF